MSERHEVGLVELIPPFHQRVYRMGLEHIGFVVGDAFDTFVETHRRVLTGQQFQGPLSMPVYILFEDYTHVKFHRLSLADVCAAEGRPITGFEHVDWQPADELADDPHLQLRTLLRELEPLGFAGSYCLAGFPLHCPRQHPRRRSVVARWQADRPVPGGAGQRRWRRRLDREKAVAAAIRTTTPTPISPG